MTSQQRPEQAETLRDWLVQASPSLLMKLIMTAGITLGLLGFLAWLTFGEGLATFSDLPLEPGVPVSAAGELGLVAQPGLVEMQVDGVDFGTVHRLDPPVALEINGFRLDVANTYLSEETLWSDVALSANQVGWLENSMINYVFRLPANRGYRDILETAVQEKGFINLVTTQGNQFDFTIVEGTTQAVTATPQQIQQKRPAITLLWLNADESGAYILSGEYIPSIHLLEASGLGGSKPAPDSELPAANLNVKLDGVDIQSDGLQLLVRGSVTNSGIQEGVVAAQEIMMLSDELRSQIISVDPPLPWHIPAGNNQMVFTAVFQRPLSSEASLTIGAQEFVLQFTPPTE